MPLHHENPARQEETGQVLRGCRGTLTQWASCSFRCGGVCSEDPRPPPMNAEPALHSSVGADGLRWINARWLAAFPPHQVSPSLVASSTSRSPTWARSLTPSTQTSTWKRSAQHALKWWHASVIAAAGPCDREDLRCPLGGWVNNDSLLSVSYFPGPQLREVINALSFLCPCLPLRTTW